jgi:hypothetical protein
MGTNVAGIIPWGVSPSRETAQVKSSEAHSDPSVTTIAKTTMSELVFIRMPATHRFLGA